MTLTTSTVHRNARTTSRIPRAHGNEPNVPELIRPPQAARECAKRTEGTRRPIGREDMERAHMNDPKGKRECTERTRLKQETPRAHGNGPNAP